jgi:hypothetical protein
LKLPKAGTPAKKQEQQKQQQQQKNNIKEQQKQEQTSTGKTHPRHNKETLKYASPT